ncbi:MAG: hypothetical protein J6U25_01070 [Clostridia bacterium]|nr:hypothetical protein [Clostridia bacterium]
MAKHDRKNDKKPVKDRFSKGLMDVSGRDSFYRSKIEIGRWSFGMQILRENFGTLVGLNVLMLLFVAPILVITIWRSYSLAEEIIKAPFAANIGLGFQPNVNLGYLPQSLIFKADYTFFVFLPIAILWLGVGIAGGAFVFRNLSWGERSNVYKAFLLGVKRCVLPILIASLVYSLFVTGGIIGYSYINLVVAQSGSAWYFIVAKIAIIAVLVYLTLWFLSYAAMAASYKAGIASLVTNSFKITNVYLPLNLFFAALSLIGFSLLFFGNSILIFSVLVVAIISMSFALLVWSVYSQWVFDRLVNPTVKERYVPTEEEKQAKKEREEAARRQQETGDGFITVGETRIRELGDVLPISKGSVEMVRFNGNFTREDLALSDEKKKQMLDDVDADSDSTDKDKK